MDTAYFRVQSNKRHDVNITVGFCFDNAQCGLKNAGYCSFDSFGGVKLLTIALLAHEIVYFDN